MDAILTAEEMALADRAAIETLRTSQTRLMELAGREASKILGRHLTGSEDESLDGFHFLIVCGKGNNGGDGFVLARHLINRNGTVDIVLLYPPETLATVNREGFAILEAYAEHCDALTICHSHDEALPSLAENRYDAVIDAMLGTGLHLEREDEPLRSPVREGIELINTIRERTSAVSVALDLPSGLDATTGCAAAPAVEADMTITMAYRKTGFFFRNGPRLSGEVVTAEISIPSFLVKECACRLTDSAFAAETFTLRETSSAKHTNGKVLIIAGSSSPSASMTGAAILATRAAIACGAGYVCVSLPEGMATALHIAAPSATVIGRNVDDIIEKAAWADSILIGCGIGRAPETIDLITKLCESPEIRNTKLVLDADALYAIASSGMDLRAQALYDALLTPHAGEFSRLSGCSAHDISEKPLDIIRRYSAEKQINLLLKGNPTLIANPSGKILINQSGTEALATAGTGDLLSGMIAAISAKGPDTWSAAAAAAWFHGRAGDLANDISSLVSSEDVLNAIPDAIAEIFFAEEEE